MFERYTEKARRMIFFARYEASQYGSSNIETEHLLLGLLREDRALARLVFGGFGSGGAIRRDIESQIQTREHISTACEIPLSPESKRILNFAAEEATKLAHAYIDTGHLLLGMLREENCLAARVLAKQGAVLSDLREKIANKAPADSRGFRPPARPSRDVSRVPFGTAVDQFREAWAARDMKKLASFFAPHGQLWDTRGELHLGPAQMEKSLASHFASSEPVELAPDVRDIKFITGEVSVATLVWEPQGEAKNPNPAPLRMVLVLYDAYPGWQIVSAHLVFLQPGPGGSPAIERPPLKRRTP